MQEISALRNRDYPLFQLWRSEFHILDVSSSPNSNLTAIADDAGYVSVLETDSGRMLWSKHAHDKGATHLDWSTDGSIIASTGQDGFIKLWRPQNGEVIKVLQIDNPQVVLLQWSPHSRKLAAICCKFVYVWERLGNGIYKPIIHKTLTSDVTKLIWLKDGNGMLVVTTNEGLLKLSCNPHLHSKITGTLL